MIVEWTIRAIVDLEHLQIYIAERNPGAARSIAARIKTSVTKLAEFPARGRPGRMPDTRELVIPDASVVVSYRMLETKLQILTVFHTSRRWPPAG